MLAAARWAGAIVVLVGSATGATAVETVTEVQVHDMCRTGEQDRDEGYRLSSAVEGAPVEIRVVAASLSRKEKQLVGWNEVHMGAYVGTVTVFVDIADAALPEGLKKDDTVWIDGVMLRSELWSNTIDQCYIYVKAKSVSIDGF